MGKIQLNTESSSLYSTIEESLFTSDKRWRDSPIAHLILMRIKEY